MRRAIFFYTGERMLHTLISVVLRVLVWWPALVGHPRAPPGLDRQGDAITPREACWFFAYQPTNPAGCWCLVRTVVAYLLIG